LTLKNSDLENYKGKLEIWIYPQQKKKGQTKNHSFTLPAMPYALCLFPPAPVTLFTFTVGKGIKKKKIEILQFKIRPPTLFLYVCTFPRPAPFFKTDKTDKRKWEQ